MNDSTVMIFSTQRYIGLSNIDADEIYNFVRTMTGPIKIKIQKIKPITGTGKISKSIPLKLCTYDDAIVQFYSYLDSITIVNGPIENSSQYNIPKCVKVRFYTLCDRSDIINYRIGIFTNTPNTKYIPHIGFYLEVETIHLLAMPTNLMINLLGRFTKIGDLAIDDGGDCPHYDLDELSEVISGIEISTIYIKTAKKSINIDWILKHKSIKKCKIFHSGNKRLTCYGSSENPPILELSRNTKFVTLSD